MPAASALTQLFDEWRLKLEHSPERGKAVDACFRWQIEGEQTEDWVIDCTANPSAMRANDRQTRCDCTIAIRAEDLLRLASGVLNPQHAYLQGILSLRGSQDAVMRLNLLLDLLCQHGGAS